MTRRGRIPDDIYNQIETNSRHTHGTCDRCGSESRQFVEHPNKEEIYICSKCEAEILMEQEGFDT